MQPRTCHLCCRTIASPLSRICSRCSNTCVCSACVCVCGRCVSRWAWGEVYLPRWVGGVSRARVPAGVVRPCASLRFCLHCGFWRRRRRLWCLRGLIERLSLSWSWSWSWPAAACSWPNAVALALVGEPHRTSQTDYDRF